MIVGIDIFWHENLVTDSWRRCQSWKLKAGMVVMQVQFVA
jgi:hypothetical protein